MRLDLTSSLDLATLDGFVIKTSLKDYNILLSCLVYETHRANRMAVLDYIDSLSLEPFPFPVIEVGYLISCIPTKLRSIRASELESGVYLTRFIFSTAVLRDGYILDDDVFGFTFAKITYPVSCRLLFIMRLSELLEHHIVIAKDNLVGSSSEYPLNGVLAAIAKVLENVDIKKVISEEPESQLFIDLFCKISSQCHAACQIVLEICSHASPEGNIPASFQEMGSTILSIINSTGSKSDILAQIVLRHCFRTLKEATDCLLIIITNIPYCILKIDEKLMNIVLTAGELIRSLVTLVRHRGALSASHENLQKLIMYISKSGVGSLEILPGKWLDDYFQQMITYGISVTRRSAGLPYAIQAILSANPASKKLMDKTNNFLFSVIEAEVTRNEHHDLPQVHALNIMKILVHDSVLVIGMTRFYEKIFHVCLQQFKSSYFPITNCAGFYFLL
jgi:hypothetical protein